MRLWWDIFLCLQSLCRCCIALCPALCPGALPTAPALRLGACVGGRVGARVQRRFIRLCCVRCAPSISPNASAPPYFLCSHVAARHRSFRKGKLISSVSSVHVQATPACASSRERDFHTRRLHRPVPPRPQSGTTSTPAPEPSSASLRNATLMQGVLILLSWATAWS